LEQGRYAEAEPLVDRAIAILDRAGFAPGRRFECYLLRARIAWQRQLRSEAMADLHQAMQLSEQQRAESSGSAHERAETFTRYNEAFEQMVAWQLELKDISEALAAMERGRARSLLEEMAQSGVDLLAGRSALECERLRKREMELKRQVDELEKQIATLPTDREKSAVARPSARLRIFQDRRQHCLNFRPEPHGQGSLRPVRPAGRDAPPSARRCARRRRITAAASPPA
jgi:hypothetical protein